MQDRAPSFRVWMVVDTGSLWRLRQHGPHNLVYRIKADMQAGRAIVNDRSLLPVRALGPAHAATESGRHFLRERDFDAGLLREGGHQMSEQRENASKTCGKPVQSSKGNTPQDEAGGGKHGRGKGRAFRSLTIAIGSGAVSAIFNLFSIAYPRRVSRSPIHSPTENPLGNPGVRLKRVYAAEQ